MKARIHVIGMVLLFAGSSVFVERSIVAVPAREGGADCATDRTSTGVNFYAA